MLNDDLNLQISQESAKTVQYCERQSSLQRPHRLSAVELDDNGNMKFAVGMEKQAREKMTGYIRSSLRSSVNNTVNLGSENTFSLDSDGLSLMSSSNSTVKYTATMTQGSRLMSAWNGDANLLPERQNSVQPARSMRKSCSFPTTLTQLGSASVQRKSSTCGDQSEVADEQTMAGAVLPQSSVNNKSQSEMVLQPPALNVNAEIASEVAKESARHSALKTSGERNVIGITTKSNAHRVRRTRNAASTKTDGSKQSTSSGARNVANEMIVIENSQPAMSVSLNSEVRPSCESTVDNDSNQTGINGTSSKLEQSRKPASGIPYCGSSKLSTSRIPAGSKKRDNSLKVSGNTFTTQASGSRASRLSMTSSSSNISSQPTDTKARASVSDSTRLGIPKPSGMFHN